MTPEQRKAKFREIATAAAGKFPSETDFTYRHAEVPYTLQRLQVALRICAAHLIEHPTQVTLTALQDMHEDAGRLKRSDPREFGRSILRGQEFAGQRGIS